MILGDAGWTWKHHVTLWCDYVGMSQGLDQIKIDLGKMDEHGVWLVYACFVPSCTIGILLDQYHIPLALCGHVECWVLILFFSSSPPPSPEMFGCLPSPRNQCSTQTLHGTAIYADGVVSGANGAAYIYIYMWQSHGAFGVGLSFTPSNSAYLLRRRFFNRPLTCRIL